jgi:hypothetical protein
MPAPMLRRPSERAKSWPACAHRKSIPLRKLERQESGASGGAVFMRSFGVWFVYEIRCYVSMEMRRCSGRLLREHGPSQAKIAAAISNIIPAPLP